MVTFLSSFKSDQNETVWTVSTIFQSLIYLIALTKIYTYAGVNGYIFKKTNKNVCPFRRRLHVHINILNTNCEILSTDL